MLNDMAAQGAAGNTMMRVRAVLSMAMSDAVRRRIMEWNPVSVTEPPSGPKRPSRAMNSVRVRAFLKAAQDDRLEAMWLVGLMIGLRPGELCGLTWSDIDLDGEVIHIRRSRLHRPDGMRLGDPKTPYSVRTVDLPERVVESLRRHKALQAQERLASVFWASPELVFCDSGGTPLSRWRLARLLKDVTQRAGLGTWQPRELRRTAISMMFDVGLSREMVADVVGHAPGSNMTAGTYRPQLRASVPGAKTAMDALFRAESETG